MTAHGRIARTAGHAVAFAALLLAGHAVAAPTACPNFFFGGNAPDLRNEKLVPKTRPLCFSSFSVLHSGLTRTPLWSAERLTADAVASAKEMERVNSFHAETSLPASERAELSDYVGSGYDRGHMAPSGDMPDGLTQDESFTLANMIPQDPDNNRRLWRGVESAVRYLTKREGEVYVVTGPVFAGAEVKALRGRVLVPSHVFKAVYVPRTGAMGVYVAPNAPGETWSVVSVADIRASTGIDPFPSAPEASKAVASRLPEARVTGKPVESRTSSPVPHVPQATGMGEAARRMMRRMW